MEKKKYRTQERLRSERLYSAIEQRAEMKSGEFKPQEVANTLWAYATMGWAEATLGEFKPQEVTNTDC